MISLQLIEAQESQALDKCIASQEICNNRCIRSGQDSSAQNACVNGCLATTLSCVKREEAEKAKRNNNPTAAVARPAKSTRANEADRKQAKSPEKSPPKASVVQSGNASVGGASQSSGGVNKPSSSGETAALPAQTVALPAQAAPLQHRVALVIGNSAYRSAPALPNPANDEADVAQVLRELNFDVIEGRDLDRRATEDAIRQFGHKLNEADLALFFYSGHGLQVDGKNYLVPVDAKLERVSDLALDAIDVGMVLAQMEDGQRVNLVFLDACRDSPLVRSLGHSIGSRSVTIGQGLGVIEGALGTMIAFSTQPDNVALDGTGRNSPFTSALLKHLKDPDDVGVVMRRVRADVIAATHKKQIPWDHSSLVGEVFLAR
jgi:Caspase domain